MAKKLNIANTLFVLVKMVRYNLRIIFANKFIWFLLASFGFFLFVAFQTVYNGGHLSEETVFDILIFPGILLIFYPSVFGIQNDDDSRMLEILFGIPNYRYKVWLVRLIIIYALVYFITVLLSITSSVLLYRVDVFEMSNQLMFPVIFMGSLAFMFSTIIKNGNGTAVVMVIFGIVLLILADALDRSQWNIFLNPYDVPRNMNQIIWQGIVSKNRIILSVGTVVFILYGLFNLQKREKFV